MPKKEVPPFIQKLRQVFSHNLEVCRKNKGYTQDKISELVGISQAFYSQVERGNNLVGLPVLMKLANILDVSANALLYEHKEAFKKYFLLNYAGAKSQPEINSAKESESIIEESSSLEQAKEYADRRGTVNMDILNQF